MYPRQIASDLARFFHARIAQWHSGELSSYDLLELFGVTITDPETYTVSTFVWDSSAKARAEVTAEIVVDPDNPGRLLPSDRKPERTMRVDFAPANGAVAKALRDGRRSEQEQAIVQIANVAALFRSAKFPNADTEQYGEQLFLSTERMRELEEQQRMRVSAMREFNHGEPEGLAALWHL